MLERYIVFSNLFFGFDRVARKSGGARERLSLLCEGWGGSYQKTGIHICWKSLISRGSFL